MRENLVSIIVPTYNADQFIDVCMESLINQSYQNIEILIIDDGSFDETLLKCRKYAEKDLRIKVIPIQHQGVSCARNIGIRESKGKYITFVDADDYTEKTLIEKYVSYMDEEDVAFTLCGMFHESMIGKQSTDIQVMDSEKKDLTVERNEIAYLSWLKLFNFVTNKIYRLDEIKAHHINFDPDIQIGEDLDFNLEYLESIPGKIGVLNRPLYHYLKRSDNSLSLIYYPNAIEHTKYIYHRLIEFAKELQDSTKDDILVLQSIYLYDWTSRLTALFEDKCVKLSTISKRRIINRQLRSNEFQELLIEVRKARKISFVRYCSLRMRNYTVFYCLRDFYHLLYNKWKLLK